MKVEELIKLLKPHAGKDVYLEIASCQNGSIDGCYASELEEQHLGFGDDSVYLNAQCGDHR